MPACTVVSMSYRVVTITLLAGAASSLHALQAPSTERNATARTSPAVRAATTTTQPARQPPSHVCAAEYSWAPRTDSVQTDSAGSATGDRASLYRRSKSALSEGLPILDGLQPLSQGMEAQELNAARAVVRSELTQLVNELGRERGPVVSQLENRFTRLDVAFVRLSRALCLEQMKVDPIGAEKNVTNFRLLTGHIESARESWMATRKAPNSSATRVPDPQLSHALLAVSESVEDTHDAMDAVFLGPAERQSLRLRIPGEGAVFVGELLDRVNRLALEEGPRWIARGSSTDLAQLHDTTSQLLHVLRGIMVPPQDAEKVPIRYRSSRVQRALQELATHLDDTARLAADATK